jgi:hypothetical protein
MEGLKKAVKETSVKIACVLAEIRTKYLPNTSLEGRCYANAVSE